MEDRRTTLLKAWIFIAFMLAAGLFVVYHAWDPHIDDAGIIVGVTFLIMMFVLPAVAVFFIGVPGSRGLSLDTREQEYRYWYRWFGIPIRRGKCLLKTSNIACEPETIRIRGNMQMSKTGCLLGFLGPLGTLASLLSTIASQQPHTFRKASVVVLKNEGSKVLRLVTFETNAARIFVEQAKSIANTQSQQLP